MVASNHALYASAASPGLHQHKGEACCREFAQFGEGYDIRRSGIVTLKGTQAGYDRWCFSFEQGSCRMQPEMRAYQDKTDYWRIRAFLRELLVLNDLRERSWHLYRWDYCRW